MKAHNDIGPGHREEAYAKALTMRFQEVELTFEEEVNVKASISAEKDFGPP